MLLVAGGLSCKGYRNCHHYSGKSATCVQRGVPVVSRTALGNRLLWQSWHSVLRSDLTGEIYTLGRNSITSHGVSYRFEIENITDHLGRVIQLYFS